LRPILKTPFENERTESINLADNTITLRNPHGWKAGEVTMPFDEFQDAFMKVSVNPLTP